jgi:superfamily II DNA or RNA helicase
VPVSPLPHQYAAIAHNLALLSSGRRTSLEGSDPGVGKTYIAAFVFKQLGIRPGILCPKTIISQWREALAAVGVEPLFVTNYEQAKLPKFQQGRWKVKGRVYEWGSGVAGLVFDECHRCKERTTQNAKLMMAARRQGIPTLAMSATAAQDPLDLYALGYLLGLHNGVDFMSFAFAHGVVRGRFAFEFHGGKPALDKLHDLIFPSRGNRTRYADIPGFPEEHTEAVSLDCGAAGEAVTRELAEIYNRIREIEAEKGQATEAITLRLRARQVAELAKVPAMVELIRDLVAEGMSVPVFVNFHDSLNALSACFKDAPKIVGGQSEAERSQAIADFQANRKPVILCQAEAGGTGVSLHDLHGRPRCSVISTPESARTLVQILGRNRRAGQKSPAFRKLVFAAGTIEEKVRKACEKKVKQIEQINDGDLDPISK